MASPDASWRPMRSGDLARVDEVADAIHTLFERAEVFAEKFRLYSRGCFVLDCAGAIVGYGISHPWLLQSVPPLDTYLEALPNEPQCLYLHDVAVLPEARGRGAVRSLCGALDALARRDGLDAMALVSVYGTAPLWASMGFEVCAAPSVADKLGSYGPSARYMTRAVT